MFFLRIGAGQVNDMKYYIKTFGCQMNVSDSERIAGFLEAQKIKSARDIKQANIAIFNTCGVRQTAEDRVYGQIHNLRKNNPISIIILTGCLANRKDVQRRLKDKVNLFVSINDLFKIKNLKLFQNSKLKIQNSFEQNCNYLKMSPRYSSKSTAYVPIMTGCNNFCSYCVVPYARGQEISRPAEDIIKEIDNLAKKKYKEIILLGQNVNSYKYKPSLLTSLPKGERDIKNSSSPFGGGCREATEEGFFINFPKLLSFLAQTYPGITFKFLTSHPKYFSEELIKIIAKNKNISREIHLPVQAGSDKILKAMNRPYTQKKYLDLIKKIKKTIPEASFTTDVIVGFPGETQKYFQETIKVFKKINYNEAYINKYSPRPGTAAYKLKDSVSWDEKKRREKILRNYVKF